MLCATHETRPLARNDDVLPRFLLVFTAPCVNQPIRVPFLSLPVRDDKMSCVILLENDAMKASKVVAMKTDDYCRDVRRGSTIFENETIF